MSITAERLDQDSVTEWITQVQQQDSKALQRIWERYFQRLVSLARARIRRGNKGLATEEDVASQAFSRLIFGLLGGRFPMIRDRDDLWQLLVTITTREAGDQRKYDGSKRRDHRRTISEGSLIRGDAEGQSGFDTMVGFGPTPEFLAMVAEEYGRLLELLPSEQLRKIAVARMECYTLDEIAEMQGSSRRDVSRKIKDIRRAWGEELAPTSPN